MGKRVNCFKCDDTDVRWVPHWLIKLAEGAWMCEVHYSEFAWKASEEWGSLTAPEDVAPAVARIIESVKALMEHRSNENHLLTLVAVRVTDHPPEVHTRPVSLSMISERLDWDWEIVYDEAGELMHYRPAVIIDGVRFFTVILDDDDARKYGCPEEVIDIAR